MTIIEAIGSIDVLKPNTYPKEQKIKWLSNLDGKIKIEILDTHESSNRLQFEGYNEKTPLNTVLLVTSPYDEIYLRWLEAQIDYHNGEYGKFNNAIIMFNAAYDAFAAYYNRTNMPKKHGERFIF